MSNLDKDAFIRCHEAIHLVCSSAVPSIQDVIQTWHSHQQQNIGFCTNPQQCPTSVKGKPKPSKSCQACSGWGSALETVEYTDQAQAINSSIAWTNINPTQLFKDPVEVAKAFGIRFPKGQPHPTTFDEFDTASLLLMMMKFGEFHRRNHINYFIIKKVSAIRNSLSHLKLKDKLHISGATLMSNFQDILDFVDCIQRLHPNHFTDTLVSDIRSQLHGVITAPITDKMRDEALKPFTDAMKDVVCQTIEEQFKQFTPNISSSVAASVSKEIKEFQQTSQVQQQAQTTAMEGMHTKMEALSQNVQENIQAEFQQTSQIQQQATTTAMEGMHTKMETLSQNVQKTIQSEFQHTSQVQQQAQTTAMEGMHTKMETLSQSLQENILDLGQQVEQGVESLHSKLDSVNVGLQVEDDTLAEIATWTDRLIRKYMKDRRMIRFGRNRRAIAETDDIFVDLTLVNEREDSIESPAQLRMSRRLRTPNRVGSLGRSLLKELSKGEYKTRASGEKYENVTRASGKKGKMGSELKSYDQLFTIPISKDDNSPANHLLLHGPAGSGKTTLLSRLAYLWAKSKCVSPGGSFSASDNGELVWNRFQLILVLELKKLGQRENLEMTIQKQLLPDIPPKRIASVLTLLGTECLIFLDGFDEIPKDLEDHVLESPLLSECSVIVATRPHLVDEFCQIPDKSKYVLVQISGFSSENSEKYIQKFFNRTNQSELGLALVEKMHEIPILGILASIPILLVMICLLWKESPSDESRFQSMTMLYENAVKYLHKPFQKKYQLSSEVMETILLKLGKPALEALFNNTVQIKSSRFDQDILQQSFDIGLTIEEEGALVSDAYVTFVHKTFQEFCAAKYLAHLFESRDPAFQSTLDKLQKDNVHDMEYVLQFCGGLSTGTAQNVLHHVVNMRMKQPWSLPLLLLYEAEMYNQSEATDILHAELVSLSDVEMYLNRSTSVMAFCDFALSDQNKSHVWLQNPKEVYFETCKVDANRVILSLSRMLSLTMVKLVKVELVGDVDRNISASCKSLTEFTVVGSVSMSANTMIRLLGCMPSITTVTLGSDEFGKEVSLVGDVDSNISASCESLTKYTMKSGSVSANTMIRLLGCMPSVTSVTLGGYGRFSVLGEVLGDVEGTICEFLIGFIMNSVSVSVNTLLRLLRCMPSVKSCRFIRMQLLLDDDVDLGCVSLVRIHQLIFGDVASNKSPCTKKSSCTIETTFILLGSGEFTIEHGSVSANTMVRLFDNMPSVISVNLDKVRLEGEIDGNISASSKVLIKFTLEYQPVSAHTIERLLGCMPAVKSVNFGKLELTCTIECGPVSAKFANTMMRLLGCLSSVKLVTFDTVEF